MGRFLTYNLAPIKHVGEALRAERQRQGFTIDYISRLTRIPVKYLTALEKGEAKNLPGDNYRRYFIRSYAPALGLPVDKLLTLDASYPDLAPAAAIKKPTKIANAVVHPYRLFFSVAVVAGIIFYLLSAAWSTFVPPRLELFEPANNQSTLSATIKVRGVTRVGTPVLINGQAVEVSETGSFLQEVPLRPGLNTISVTAQKAYSQPTVITRRVIFTPLPSLISQYN